MIRPLKSLVRRHFGPRRRIIFAAVGGLLVISALSLGAIHWANKHAETVSDASAKQVTQIHSGLLESELQKFRLLPLVLMEYPDVRSVLKTNDPSATARLNGKLELLANRTDASVIYLVTPEGRATATSKWRTRQESSFAIDWSFRSYFVEAVREGSAELFALGTLTGRPGLYIANRIDDGNEVLGVIVIKVEFDHLESAWAQQAGPTLVTDDDGIVLITSRPDWRFKSIEQLSRRKIAEVQHSLQFGAEPIKPIDFRYAGATIYEPSPRETVNYRAASAPASIAGGRLMFLQPLGPARDNAAVTARLVILATVIVVALVLAAMLSARERVLMRAQAQRTLEREVSLRTAELTDVNERLTEESRERTRADISLRAAREELAQANRLGSIGQITAGVAHEINQPVAAIRTFAENAGRFLERKQFDKACANIDLIVDLTARIGVITSELRSFAKRGTTSLAAIDVDNAVDGTLLLTGDVLRQQGVTVERSRQSENVAVMADKVRLEQVLINLIQNALEALVDTTEPHLRISVELEGKDSVILEVADNGPGVPDDLVDQLFTPFVTGRTNGLGLGLGISRDIAREFGGELVMLPSDMGGAAFRLRLKRA